MSPRPVTPEDEVGARMIAHYNAAKAGTAKPAAYIPLNRRPDQPSAALQAHLRQTVMGEAPAAAPVAEPEQQDPKAVAFAMLEPETREAVVRQEPWAEALFRQALTYVEQERLTPTGWRLGDPE